MKTSLADQQRLQQRGAAPAPEPAPISDRAGRVMSINAPLSRRRDGCRPRGEGLRGLGDAPDVRDLRAAGRDPRMGAGASGAVLKATFKQGLIN